MNLKIKAHTLKYWLISANLIIILIFYWTSRTNSNVANTKLTNMSFKNKVHDFEEILAGKSVSTLFEFSNTGESPLLIKEVTTSCGCTVPEWPKEVIQPNGKGTIKIVYDAKYPGRFNKTVTVVYNGKNSPLELTIKGEVPYPKKEAKFTSNKIK